MIVPPLKASPRQKEIARRYLAALEQHLADLEKGMTERSLEIRQFADMLHIGARHLSNTIQQVLGVSPCSIYETMLIRMIEKMLRETPDPIGEIAARLHYDPSNFTKFFKAYTGITPKQYRMQQTDLRDKENSTFRSAR